MQKVEIGCKMTVSSHRTFYSIRFFNELAESHVRRFGKNGVRRGFVWISALYFISNLALFLHGKGNRSKTLNNSLISDRCNHAPPCTLYALLCARKFFVEDKPANTRRELELRKLHLRCSVRLEFSRRKDRASWP